MERSGRPLSRGGRFDSPFIRGYLAVLESIVDQTGAFMGVDDSHRHSVTLKDIAAMADVSSMTVSNFINGKFHAMSAETREKLGKILQKYPYRPHGSARNLRLSRAFSIGLVVVDDSPHFLTRQVIGSIIAGLATELNDNGYSLTVQGVRPSAMGNSPVLLHQLTDALCVVAAAFGEQRDSIVDFFASQGQPLALLQMELPAPREDVCVLRMDEYGGSLQIARKCISLGARKILMILPAVSWPSLQARIRGVEAAVLESLGLCSLELLSVPEEYEGAFTRIQERLESPGMPDAIITSNNQIAFIVTQLLQRDNDRADSVMLATYDINSPWNYRKSLCASVVLPSHELGVRTAQALLDRLETGVFESRDIVLPVSLHEDVRNMRSSE